MEQTERVLELLSNLEQRLALVEERLGIEPPHTPSPAVSKGGPLPEEGMTSGTDDEREEELEYELGQSWFAKVGIVALALGIAFLLTLPFDGFPQVVVSFLGYVLGGGLFFLSRIWKESLTLLSNYMRGAAIALLYFSTMRLTYFSADPALPPDSVFSFIPLVAAVILAFYLALRRASANLTLLATVLGYVTLFAAHSFAMIVIGTVALAGFLSSLYARKEWTGVYYAAMVLSTLTVAHWAVGGPFVTGSFTLVTSPEWGMLVPLVVSIVFAAGTLKRPTKDEGYDIAGSAVLNAGGAYALILALTLTSFGENAVAWHLLSSAVLLGLAVAFWISERSTYSTFLYAMAGYQALTVALLLAFEVPEVFVWLSIQSLVVVATAVWFRSRFIVVVNFLIYVVIFLGYLLVAEQESGFSFGFGVVALISARILNWQQKNLQLKTEVMRNAYLISAFVVIPYSLYHSIPGDYVALSWVAVALLYYALSAVMKLQKYRWMGHATLMLTALYVLMIGIIRLDTTFRVISFLVLGIVLLGTSMFLTRRRLQKAEMKRREMEATRAADEELSREPDRL